jgi:mono/diheme cytochrome c family protein
MSMRVVKFWSIEQLPVSKAVTAGLIAAAALGLHIPSHADTTATEEITYNGQVAAIVNENCVVCHREGGIAPMQLTSYEKVRPWAPIMAYRVKRREMPPYAYDQGIGIQHLIGDWRLEQDEIDTIVAWVDQGAPLGNPDIVAPLADIPSLDQWNFEDELGPPDLVLESEPIDIPAAGNDMWHRPYTLTGINDTRCIRAMQVKPKGPAKAVVHHANSSVEIPKEDGTYERFSQLTEYAMGKWGEMMPEGVCRTLPPNGRIAWDIHMYPGGLGAMAPGEMIEDNVVELGVWFYEAGYEEQARYKQDLRLYRLGAQGDLIVPPNGYEMTQGFHSFDHPVRIDSFQPHGHLRMRAASLEVYFPETGRTEPISQISNWSATWHHNHIYEPDVAPLLPTGAVIVLKQWYDNTRANPNNPDPDQFVMGGSRTADEMTHAWLAVTHLDEEGYQELLAQRAQRLEQTTASAGQN